MGVTKEELNLLELFKDLGSICLTEEVCHKCAGVNCLVGFSKDCAAKCRINNQTFVKDGFENIPPSDIRGGYDEYNVLYAISHLLTQCRSCKNDHYDDCIINIIRSCLEVIEFGDVQGYEGDVLSYMLKLRDKKADKADLIAEEYRNHRELQLEQNEK